MIIYIVISVLLIISIILFVLDTKMIIDLDHSIEFMCTMIIIFLFMNILFLRIHFNNYEYSLKENMKTYLYITTKLENLDQYDYEETIQEAIEFNNNYDRHINNHKSILYGIFTLDERQYEGIEKIDIQSYLEDK